MELKKSAFADMMSASPRMVGRWLAFDETPSEMARKRIVELTSVLEHLSKVLKPDAANDWLYERNQFLDSRAPVDLIQEGKYTQVMSAIDAMGDGVFI